MKKAAVAGVAGLLLCMGLFVYAENTADTVVEITQNTAGPQ